MSPFVSAPRAFTAAGFLDTTTDPRGIVQKNYYDNLGRMTKTIQDYTDGTPTNNTNKTTEYTFDGNNHTLTIKADMPAGAYETTQYVYGVTVTGGSNIYSNDMLAAVQYPDPTTGNPSSSQQVSYTVNGLAQNLTMSDRDGNVHSHSYDVLGRLTSDAVTTLGTGVDGSIRRIETAYDTGDRAYLFTSYNAASGGSIVNQVQDAFNGLGQLITEWQAHSSAVNTNTSPKVQYTYTLMSGGVNNSRLTSMTYPSLGQQQRRVITYNYATGVDDRISRLTSISDGATTLESLSYLGLSTVVIRSYPQPGTELTYVKLSGESNGDAGDQYTGLDRFGRVVDQRWILTSNGTALDRFQYGFDRDSNVLYSNNLVNSSFSELYHANGASNGYDQLNQLTAFARGTLSDTNSDGIPDTISSPSHSQSWGFDALGNWTTFTSDASNQTRTANQQNQITSISGLTTPVYDSNGNMTGDQSGNTLIFDAWNRLVQVKNGQTVLETYAYDALGRRTTENPGTPRDLFWDSAWQLVEEDVAGSMTDQYVWSTVYIDALIERDTPTLRMYALQNANFNVTSLVDTLGTVQERYDYDPFGAFTVLAANWTTRGTSNYGWVIFHEGGRYDFATGLFAFRERDYSSTLGRWLENDPLGLNAGDTNLYRSLSDNPTGNVDPLGMDDLVTVPGPVNAAEGLPQPRPQPNKPNNIPPGQPGWNGWPSWFHLRPPGNPVSALPNPMGSVMGWTFVYGDGSTITIDDSLLHPSITWQPPPNGQKPGPSFVFLPDGSVSDPGLRPRRPPFDISGGMSIGPNPWKPGELEQMQRRCKRCWLEDNALLIGFGPMDIVITDPSGENWACGSGYGMIPRGGGPVYLPPMTPTPDPIVTPPAGGRPGPYYPPNYPGYWNVGGSNWK
jgi:RHS repeat-associated protein